jgi:hypothetical protein
MGAAGARLIWSPRSNLVLYAPDDRHPACPAEGHPGLRWRGLESKRQRSHL